jgi:hypothetical protein
MKLTQWMTGLQYLKSVFNLPCSVSLYHPPAKHESLPLFPGRRNGHTVKPCTEKGNLEFRCDYTSVSAINIESGLKTVKGTEGMHNLCRSRLLVSESVSQSSQCIALQSLLNRVSTAKHRSHTLHDAGFNELQLFGAMGNTRNGSGATGRNWLWEGRL